MQPCEAALPGAPESPFVPWMAICPGPPSNSWRTSDRALVASANGPPDLGGDVERLLDEEPAGGSRRRRLADDGREPPYDAPEVVDRHPAGGEVEREPPRGRGAPRPVGADPALVPVGPPGEPDAHPGLPARGERTAEHGQDGPHARERPAGADPLDRSRVPVRPGPDDVIVLQDHQPLVGGHPAPGGFRRRDREHAAETARSAAANGGGAGGMTHPVNWDGPRRGADHGRRTGAVARASASWRGWRP